MCLLNWITKLPKKVETEVASSTTHYSSTSGPSVANVALSNSTVVLTPPSASSSIQSSEVESLTVHSPSTTYTSVTNNGTISVRTVEFTFPSLPSASSSIQSIPSDLGTLLSGPNQIRLASYPRSAIGKQSRQFVPSWFDSRPWLEYSVEKDAAYCYCLSPHHLATTLTKPSSRQVFVIGKRCWTK